MSKPKPKQKWKKSMEHIQNQKSKWRQYSTDKHTILKSMREMSIGQLQEKYPNMPDYFWRDSGEHFCFFKIFFLKNNIF